MQNFMNAIYPNAIKVENSTLCTFLFVRVSHLKHLFIFTSTFCILYYIRTHPKGIDYPASRNSSRDKKGLQDWIMGRGDHEKLMHSRLSLSILNVHFYLVISQFPKGSSKNSKTDESFIKNQFYIIEK